jgi:enamine deaminase RidA (YjgF/YER057c/UK114 family)
MRVSQPLFVDGQRMNYAKGVIAQGRFLFLSGVTGSGATTADQVEYCWTNVKLRLEEMGGRLENIVQRQTFVTDMEEWRTEGGPRQREWLLANCPSLLEDGGQPASTLIGCMALSRPDIKVEIQVVVVLDD